MVGYSLLLIYSMFLGLFNVSASTYTPTNNMFENTYSNNLIDMADSQIKNFAYKKYAIFVIDNNYYLVAAKDVSVSGNKITFTDSTIISATRGSNYNYTYSTKEESSTTVNANYMLISNIKYNKSVNSSRVSEYQFRYNLTLLGTFILALCFALFLGRL